MEAGNRCKDENLPEEVIRRIVDVTSDINLCYSELRTAVHTDSGAKPEYICGWFAYGGSFDRS